MQLPATAHRRAPGPPQGHLRHAARALRDGYVLAGGRARASWSSPTGGQAAVYFGGKSRIVDFALSNALNSGIRASPGHQYKAHSLIRTCSALNFLQPVRNESFDILPPASAWAATSGTRAPPTPSTRTSTSSTATSPTTS